MPSTLSLDAPSLQALVAAYLPGGKVSVDKGRLRYVHLTSGLSVVLDRLSAGATVEAGRISISIQNMDLDGDRVVAAFTLTAASAAT